MSNKCDFRFQRSFVGVGVAAAATALIVTGCGSSGGSKAAATPSASPSSAAAQVGGKAGFTGQSICNAVAPSQVEQALGNPVGAGKPAEPKPGIHACSWTAENGKNALVAVVFDDAFDKKFVDDAVALVNTAAGTDLPTATSTTIDVGARNVTVYGLSSPTERVRYAGLATVANTVNDFIVEADKAARS